MDSFFYIALPTSFLFGKETYFGGGNFPNEFKLSIYLSWNVAKMLTVFQLPISLFLKDLVFLGFGVMLITGENQK